MFPFGLRPGTCVSPSRLAPGTTGVLCVPFSSSTPARSQVSGVLGYSRTLNHYSFRTAVG